MFAVFYASGDRRFYGFFMLAPFIGTGKCRGSGGIILRPIPNGIAVGMRVGEVIGNAPRTEISTAELRAVLEVHGDAAIAEDVIADSDRAAAVKGDIQRAALLRGCKGIAADLVQVGCTADHLRHVRVAKGIIADRIGIALEHQGERRRRLIIKNVLALTVAADEADSMTLIARGDHELAEVFNRSGVSYDTVILTEWISRGLLDRHFKVRKRDGAQFTTDRAVLVHGVVSAVDSIMLYGTENIAACAVYIRFDPLDMRDIAEFSADSHIGVGHDEAVYTVNSRKIFAVDRHGFDDIALIGRDGQGDLIALACGIVRRGDRTVLDRIYFNTV